MLRESLSIESPEKIRELGFNFEHQGKQFRAEVDPKSLLKQDDGVVIAYNLSHKDDVYGRVTGLLQADGEFGRKFTVMVANNFTNQESDGYNSQLPEVKGLVRRFVVEALNHGVISSWISDTARRDGAEVMYEKLGEEPGIHVVLVPRGVNSLNRDLPAYMVWKEAEEVMAA